MHGKPTSRIRASSHRKLIKPGDRSKTQSDECYKDCSREQISKRLQKHVASRDGSADQYKWLKGRKQLRSLGMKEHKKKLYKNMWSITKLWDEDGKKSEL